MLKAGSLYYALLISLIISIICSLMIGLAFMSRTFFFHLDRQEQVLDNSRSGIDFLLSNQSHLKDTKKVMDLFDKEADTVSLKRRSWGLFQILSSKARFKRNSYNRAAIAGFSTPEYDSVAIWLTDRNRPLLVSGTALLRGNLHISAKGIDRAYIEGKNYSRMELFYGKLKSSKSVLPKVAIDYKKYWGAYFEGKTSSMDSVLDFSGLETSKLEHSFLWKSILFHSKEPIILNDMELKGNIIIHSDKEIVVAKTSKLDQIVLIAPTIIFNGQNGSRVHAIAQDTIMVQHKSRLNYPSSLLLLKNKMGNSIIKISKDSHFKGNIMVLEEQNNRRSNYISLDISAESEVSGDIYCEGNLQLNGKVNGTIFTDNFLLATPSGIYENHILDGQVNGTFLNFDYGSFYFENANGAAKIIDWIK